LSYEKATEEDNAVSFVILVMSIFWKYRDGAVLFLARVKVRGGCERGNLKRHS